MVGDSEGFHSMEKNVRGHKLTYRPYSRGLAARSVEKSRVCRVTQREVLTPSRVNRRGHVTVKSHL
ncbi:hypothetical protein BN903_24 [Halorubrum sp. AJ67]|nr:hypothetical protein BN903_24 [Halorubrum sp. AJ67]